MKNISYSAFRNNLAKTLDKVNEDHVPVLITRKNGKPAVVVSPEDFKSHEETAYLMASPKNVQRLSQAIAGVEAGSTVRHDLIEPGSCRGPRRLGKTLRTGKRRTRSA